MPELNDDCKCQVVVLSKGLIQGQEWPACITEHEITTPAQSQESGRCDHPPDCTAEDAKRCAVRVETDLVHTCLGLSVNFYTRPIDGEWEETGAEVLLPNGSWAFWLRPKCGHEMKAELVLAGTAFWRTIVRCGKCPAHDG